MTFPEWQHRFTDTTEYTANKRRHRITVEAGLHYLNGNSLPHFSVTAVVDVASRGGWRWESGGMLHDAVLKQWPELKPIIDLHLSASNGAPMHAEGNGWYWLAGYYGGAGEQYHGRNGERQRWKDDGSFDGYRKSTPEECLRTFAEHVRIDVEAARKVASTLLNANDIPDAARPWVGVKELFMQWIDTQRPRWAQEAKDGIALLDRLIAEKDARARKGTEAEITE